MRSIFAAGTVLAVVLVLGCMGTKEMDVEVKLVDTVFSTEDVAGGIEFTVTATIRAKNSGDPGTVGIRVTLLDDLDEDVDEKIERVHLNEGEEKTIDVVLGGTAPSDADIESYYVIAAERGNTPD